MKYPNHMTVFGKYLVVFALAVLVCLPKPTSAGWTLMSARKMLLTYNLNKNSELLRRLLSNLEMQMDALGWTPAEKKMFFTARMQQAKARGGKSTVDVYRQFIAERFPD